MEQRTPERSGRHSPPRNQPKKPAQLQEGDVTNLYGLALLTTQCRLWHAPLVVFLRGREPLLKVLDSLLSYDDLLPPPHRTVCPPSPLLRQAAGSWLDKLEAGLAE
ncbi:hypothetical protein Naga_100681g4 [Nannochloropsis gaditana]|uniref:Uncharacterized protein n=1 Tax=Nannochloropsis gaditana TaxID=72520 RepID=W7TGZ9_9STRA|nr:hypothetical protein Naga_100681g4 [Nannochloropsis gaditana]